MDDTGQGPSTPRATVRQAASWFADTVWAEALYARHPVSRWRVAQYSIGDRSPVLMLPGLFESWHVMEPIAQRLHADGHPVYFTRAIGRNLGEIEPAAALAQAVLRGHGLRSVTIVAHSKGGLIGKRMMSVDDADERRVARMIAINTPFDGAPLARLAGRATRNLRPGSDALRALAEQLEVNERITTMVSSFDLHVPHFAGLPGTEHVELDVIGHFRPLRDPGVVADIARRIDR